MKLETASWGVEVHESPGYYWEERVHAPIYATERTYATYVMVESKKAYIFLLRWHF